MSGIESLVTQVKQGEDPKLQRSNNQYHVTTSEPEQPPKSCWSRLCCGSQKNTKTASKPVPSPLQKQATPAAYETNNHAVTADAEDNDGRVPGNRYLLGERPPGQRQKKTLVLDLDETLVHTSFKYIADADFEININLDSAIHRAYVRKRPGVDEFLLEVAKKWEVVIFTASLNKYADPLLDILDTERVVEARLFRESCVAHYGSYVKDLTMLGRHMKNSVIIDNSAMSYMFQPTHAIPIITWFNDNSDTQLFDLLPFLDKLADCEDVADALQQSQHLFVNGGLVKDAKIPPFRMASRQHPPTLEIPQTPTKDKTVVVVQPPPTPLTPHINSKTGRSAMNSPMAGGSFH